MVLISIPAPAWGATIVTLFAPVLTIFQSPRPRGARQRHVCLLVDSLRFQSPRPRGARLLAKLDVTFALAFQSPRPRGARLFISLHDGQYNAISIPAPAWGATTYHSRHRAFPKDFNPRARVGRDSACLHGLNYSGHAIFFANLIFDRAFAGIFRRKLLCVMQVRTEILRLFSAKGTPTYNISVPSAS